MLAGKLIYLCHTRLNIAYDVGMVSQFMHSPKESPLETDYKVLHCLKFSPERGILRRNMKLSLEAYIKADWAWSIVDLRSISRILAIVGRKLSCMG